MRVAFSLIALAAVAAPAFAAQPVDIETVTVEIPYGDVDVTSAEGRAALEARVEAKLVEACIRDVTLRFAHGRSAIDQKCVKDAKVVALAEVARVAAVGTENALKVAAN